MWGEVVSAAVASDGGRGWGVGVQMRKPRKKRRVIGCELKRQLRSPWRGSRGWSAMLTKGVKQCCEENARDCGPLGVGWFGDKLGLMEVRAVPFGMKGL